MVGLPAAVVYGLQDARAVAAGLAAEYAVECFGLCGFGGVAPRDFGGEFGAVVLEDEVALFGFVKRGDAAKCVVHHHD